MQDKKRFTILLDERLIRQVKAEAALLGLRPGELVDLILRDSLLGREEGSDASQRDVSESVRPA